MSVKECTIAPAFSTDVGGVDDEHLPWVETFVFVSGDVDPIEKTCKAIWKPDTLTLIAEALSRTALGHCTNSCVEDSFAIDMDQSFFFVQEAREVLS